jgi:hypothetical protein
VRNFGIGDVSRFENLSYEKFKQLALDSSLTACEKVGFPNAYRQGKEDLVWQDIKRKLTNLSLADQLIVDIGPGCSDVPRFLLAEAKATNSRVILCDSQEMLSLLPDGFKIEKIEGPFPACCPEFGQYVGKVNVILTYSVLHYVFDEGNVWQFLDRCLELLAVGGQLLIGDLPNHSKRARFYGSPTGVEFHQKYTGKSEVPIVESNTLMANKLDDSVIIAMVMRARNQGFDSYILPQAPELPMANRREDLLIVRP